MFYLFTQTPTTTDLHHACCRLFIVRLDLAVCRATWLFSKQLNAFISFQHAHTTTMVQTARSTAAEAVSTPMTPASRPAITSLAIAYMDATMDTAAYRANTVTVLRFQLIIS